MEQFEVDAAVQALNTLKQFAEQMAVNQAVEIARLKLHIAEIEKPHKEE